MSLNRKTRHFHAGKLRKTVGGVEFVEVAESNGVLYVSELGTFVSRNTQWRPKVGSLDDKGYCFVYLCGRGRNAARVVWEVFRGEIPDDKEIDHINTVPSDNRLENLRVVTHRENLLNPLTRPRRRKACAENARKSVASQGREKIMRAMKLGWEALKKPVRITIGDESVEYESTKVAARALGVAQGTLKNLLAGRTRHFHYGKTRGVKAEYAKEVCHV